MGEFEWAGREWQAAPLPATAASVVARLASEDHGEQAGAILELAEVAGIDPEGVMDAVWGAEGDPLLLDFAAGVLAVGSARPWRSTVGLCVSTVRQWGVVRGRLIEKGIADPLRQLRSLSALLDVVEVMILDGMEDQEAREEFLRQLYRGEATVDKGVAPAGWSDGFEGMDGLY